MQKVLVSACLLGHKVRYDGSDNAVHGLLDVWEKEGRIVSLCPEMAGGLPTPRPPAEIEDGDAEGVLRGTALVIRKDGADVTGSFIDGAESALAACWQHKVKVAILKEGSPSCGVCLVNDGKFSGKKIDGQGVTARLLSRHGISVFSEDQLMAAAKRLQELERAHGQ